MTSKQTKKKPTDNPQDGTLGNFALVLHNDDLHSFDYVIDALIKVCNHNYEQALQCTLITHHKGSCEIRQGNKELLIRMKQALTERELQTTIDTLP
ncbi:MAG: ATP-dependent Clp protease adaptor ClpS [Mariniphaga sp.]|nr:ATP-dependent Clp protease adaptor ClpS [Mariniphaga sp.]MDD4425584.1 ATP-dependent Clp protease adaptor ClpS [Mariniphaga sp.]